MNFFWKLRKKIEGYIPYGLLTHRAKIRRLVFEDLEKEETDKVAYKEKNIPSLEGLIYDKRKDDRASAEIY